VGGGCYRGEKGKGRAMVGKVFGFERVRGYEGEGGEGAKGGVDWG
jgi:hypothetical protein